MGRPEKELLSKKRVCFHAFNRKNKALFCEKTRKIKGFYSIWNIKVGIDA